MSIPKRPRTQSARPDSKPRATFSICSQRDADRIRIVVISDAGEEDVLKSFKVTESRASAAPSGSVAFSDALGAAFLHAAKAARRKAAQLDPGDT